MIGSEAMSALNRAISALQKGDLLTASSLAAKLAANKTAISDTMFRGHLADLCLQCELYFDAADLYEPMLVAAPDDVSLHYKAGTAAFKGGRIDLAEEHYTRCATLRPDHPASYLQLGHISRAKRDFEQASKHYLRYLAKSKDEKGHGYWSLADLRDFTFGKKMLAEMRQHLGKCRSNPGEASIMHFTLGIVTEQQKDFTQALRHFRLANELRQKMRPFNSTGYSGMLEGLMAADLPESPGVADADVRPIFVVGIPRSGTTLVEQILAAHSSVQATDELPYIERIAFELERKGGYGATLGRLTDYEASRYRDRYLAETRRHLSDKTSYFVDKNPNNFLHIGLIRRILPEALIINMRRELRANGLSVYRQMFPVGHDYSSDFDSIYEYFEGYLRLTAHWQDRFPGTMHAQSYEALVSDSTTEIDSLLSFCGLDTEPGCYEFYRSKQNVMMPSAAQVSQPMYTSSIEFWRNYEPLLGEEFARLNSLQA